MTRDEPFDDVDEADQGPTGLGGVAARRPVAWTNRLIIGFTVVVLLVAGWLIATSFLPQWWAQRVGQVSDGSLTAAVFAGLTCGVVFTAIPLVLLRRVVRRRARWGSRLVFLVLASLASAPNLTTLGIAVGDGVAARTAAQAMDADAPGFRGATLAGALLGALGVLSVWSLLFGRRRRRRELSELRAELRRREAEEVEDEEVEDEEEPGR